MFTFDLSDTCVLRLKHLCLTRKTLVSDGQNTCVCQDKGLHPSNKGKIGRRKRAITETINDEAKNICQMEHTRQRSFADFILNLIGGLTAYVLMPYRI
ncbi:transposase [Bacteroides sp. KG68]|uniref:transposase n=1 Tax=unclassified Bacteroides TaxID=2646097 RepID=UPI003D7F19DE